MWALRAQPRQGGGAPFEPPKLGVLCGILKGRSPFKRAWARSAHYPILSLPSGEGRGGEINVGAAHPTPPRGRNPL